MQRTMVLILLLAACALPPQEVEEPEMTFNIIPRPVHMLPGQGTYAIRPDSRVIDHTGLAGMEFNLEFLARLLGANPSTSPSKNPASGHINFILAPELTAEAYSLDVFNEMVIVKAAQPAGFFYAIQTIRQLLPVQVEDSEHPAEDLVLEIPAVHITDAPRFGWRGMHLDVSRHFFPADFIKQYIDMLALHKLNVFHWHLTDDNGWRLEIDAYPKLTEISAWRVDREHEPWREWSPVQPGEQATYGGFYTKDEVREIIAYAAERQITIIPEIEMPGHSSEVFASYPELSCQGEHIDVRPGSIWPNFEIFCAGNDSVFVFLENVLAEVMELFPAEYIHIGGDEAHKQRWEKCPKCQARIKAEGLADEHELQSWFIRQIEPVILAADKKMIGWDEILEGGLAPEATVMSWRGEDGGIAAARMGHDVIMCPYQHLYFDYYQGDEKDEPEAIGGFTPLRKVYEYDPLPDELNTEEAAHVLGAQANLWTEFVKTTDHAEYMVLPRMAALAEIVWIDPEQKDYDDFFKRAATLGQRYAALNWNYKDYFILLDS